MVGGVTWASLSAKKESLTKEKFFFQEQKRGLGSQAPKDVE